MKKTKLIASIIAVSFMWASIFGSIAGVVTNNDDQTTSTDSSIIIDYDDSYIQVDNATFINDVEIDGVTVNSTVMSNWAGDSFFNASDASSVTSALMNNWNTSYGWGDPSGLYSLLAHVHDFNYSGYNQDLNVTSDVEFANVTAWNLNVTDWQTAYGWGDHSIVGYLMSQGDPYFNASDAFGFTWEMADIWNASAGGGTNSSNITNSNGYEWPVNESNVEAAINDVGTTGWVCIGSDYTGTYEINMSGHDGVHLNFLFNVVTLSGDISFINFTDCNFGGLWNVDIRVSTQTGAIIKGYSHSDATRCDYVTINNVWIQNTGGTYGTAPWSYTEHNFTGIELFADDVGATGRIFEWYINNVIIEGANVGVLIKTSGAGYVNGCDSYHIYTEQPVTGIEFIEIASTNGANSNKFYNYRTQTAKYSEYGFKNISGGSNAIYSSLPWDWSTSEVPIYGIWIGSGGIDTEIEVDAKDLVDSLLDEGLGSSIKCGNRELYYDADYDYKVTTNGTHYYARLGEYGNMPVSGSLDRSTDFESLMVNIINEDDITVKLGNGTFIPDQFIALAGINVTIEGFGDHQTIIKAGAQQYASGIFTISGSTDCNFTLRNLVFDGTDCTDSSSCILFGLNDNTSGLTIENCIFINWNAGTSHAIRIDPRSDDIAENIYIFNSDFYNNDYAIRLEGDADPSLVINFDVSHNYLKNNLYSIHCGYARNGSISNNRIISSIAGSDGIILSDTYDVGVISNFPVTVVDDGIIESGNSDNNTIALNNPRFSGDPLTIVGAGTINLGNQV